MRQHISIRQHDISTTSVLMLLVSFVSGLSVLFIDLFALGVSPLAEGPPIFDTIYIVRTILIVVSSGLLVSALIRLRLPLCNDITQEREAAVWSSWRKIAIYVILFCALTFLFIFLSRPDIFYRLATEDNPVEILSAVFCFINFGIFVRIIFYIYSDLNQSKNLYLFIALGFASAFFLIGMEEISWFQRVFSIETPEIFKGNIQNEMNLHNFATNNVENAYYLSAFFVLILFPFVYDKLVILKDNAFFSFFLPSRFVVFFSAIFVAYNYDMWNSLFTQFSFFVTLFILLHYAWSYKRIDFNTVIVFSVIAVFILTQSLFIIFGSQFVRTWDVTEYKELLIPLSYFLYSMEVLKRAKQLKGTSRERLPSV